MIEQQDEFKHWLHQELTNIRLQLGMETAIASYIENNSYTIVDVDSEMEGIFEVGQEFPLQDTYCRAVFENRKSVCYNHVATIKSMLQHPVYQAVKLESYIASPILEEDGNVMGTLNFTSLFPHRPEFDLDEQKLVDDFAAKVSEQSRCYKSLLG